MSFLMKKKNKKKEKENDVASNELVICRHETYTPGTQLIHIVILDVAAASSFFSFLFNV